jgi:hypothetical protein
LDLIESVLIEKRKRKEQIKRRTKEKKEMKCIAVHKLEMR